MRLKEFFTPHYVGRCCTNTIPLHYCVPGYTCTNISPSTTIVPTVELTHADRQTNIETEMLTVLVHGQPI